MIAGLYTELDVDNNVDRDVGYKALLKFLNKR